MWPFLVIKFLCYIKTRLRKRNRYATKKWNKRPHNICFFFKISVKEANKVSVPTEVASIAKTINPPTNCTGMKLEKINAPKDIFEAESSTIG